MLPVTLTAAIAWGHWMMFYFLEDDEALRSLEKFLMKFVSLLLIIIFFQVILFYLIQ